jgi:hypothetical protein
MVSKQRTILFPIKKRYFSPEPCVNNCLYIKCACFAGINCFNESVPIPTATPQKNINHLLIDMEYIVSRKTKESSILFIFQQMLLKHLSFFKTYYQKSKIIFHRCFNFYYIFRYIVRQNFASFFRN